jgi:transcriptional regulator with XRE-family HTH domain
MPDTRERVAEAMRSGRRLKGLSQGELADRVGVTQEAISNIERVKSSPSVDLFAKIIGVLDLDPRGILGESAVGDLKTEERRKLEGRASQIIQRLDDRSLSAWVQIGKIVADVVRED